VQLAPVLLLTNSHTLLLCRQPDKLNLTVIGFIDSPPKSIIASSLVLGQLVERLLRTDLDSEFQQDNNNKNRP